MAVVNPVGKDAAGEELAETYAGLKSKFGKVPDFFGVMAHRPAVLKNVLALNGSIMGKGTIDAKLKELAYLKTSTLNECQY